MPLSVAPKVSLSFTVVQQAQHFSNMSAMSSCIEGQQYHVVIIFQTMHRRLVHLPQEASCLWRITSDACSGHMHRSQGERKNFLYNLSPINLYDGELTLILLAAFLSSGSIPFSWYLLIQVTQSSLFSWYGFPSVVIDLSFNVSNHTPFLRSLGLVDTRFPNLTASSLCSLRIWVMLYIFCFDSLLASSEYFFVVNGLLS